MPSRRTTSAFDVLTKSTDRQYHKRVWLLSLPIILSNVTVPLVGAADTAVMGHLPGAQNIGAVALGSSIFSLLFWTFGFLRMGSGGLVAQFHGAKNQRGINLTLLRYLLFAMLTGCMVMALQKPVLQLCLSLLAGSETLEALTSDYFGIRIYSAPATFANYVLLGTFIGLQRTSAVFTFQLVLNFVNIGLDLLFVIELGYAIEGVAWASVIAEYVALAFALTLIRTRLHSAMVELSIHQLWQKRDLLFMLNVNFDIFLRTLLLVGSFFYFHSVSARLGELTLAANAVLLQLLYISAYALDGFAHAAETLTGQATGAKNRKNFDRAVAASTLQSLLVAITITLLLAIFGTNLIGLLTNQADVITTAQTVLPWLVAMPIVSVWSYQLDGIFIGTTNTRQMRNAMLISSISFVILCEPLTRLYQNHGLWLAFLLFSLLRAATLGYALPGIRPVSMTKTNTTTPAA